MTNSAVLVTGGAGYIGSHVVLALLRAGRKPVVLDNLSTGSRELVPSGAILVEGDIADTKLVRDVISAHSCTSVMHFAASIAVEESVRKPELYWRNNAGGTACLLEACVQAEVRHLVFSSTAAVYGDAGGAPISEDTSCSPLNPYGRSKLACERMIGDIAAAHDFRFAVLRYFNVAGADPDGRSGQCGHESTHLIRVACEVALGKRDFLEIFGTDYPTADGTGVRDYIHVSDVAEAHIAALAHLESGGVSATLNLGYGKGYSVREVVTALEQLIGRPIFVKLAPRRNGDGPTVVANATRIGQVLGWKPMHDEIRHILDTSLAWERKRSTGGSL